MAKFVCPICGYIHEGLEAPAKCPICTAPSSKFRLENGKSKSDSLQKINEEDYEIIKKIETDGYLKAVEWYKENYDCNLSDAKEVVKTVRDKYKVESMDDVEILSMWNSLQEQSKVIKWYQETYDVSSQDATSKVNAVLYSKANIGGTSNNGCIITILIAITSTLSAFLLF